ALLGLQRLDVLLLLRLAPRSWFGARRVGQRDDRRGKGEVLELRASPEQIVRGLRAGAAQGDRLEALLGVGRGRQAIGDLPRGHKLFQEIVYLRRSRLRAFRGLDNHRAEERVVVETAELPALDLVVLAVPKERAEDRVERSEEELAEAGVDGFVEGRARTSVA